MFHPLTLTTPVVMGTGVDKTYLLGFFKLLYEFFYFLFLYSTENLCCKCMLHTFLYDLCDDVKLLLGGSVSDWFSSLCSSALIGGLRVLVLLSQVFVSLAIVLLLCWILRSHLIGPFYRKLHAESKGNKEMLVLGTAAFVFLMLSVSLSTNDPRFCGDRRRRDFLFLHRAGD